MTRQSINLYSEALRPKVDWLSLNLVAGYIGIFLLTLITASVIDLWDRRTVAMSAVSEATDLENLQQEIQSLEQLIQSRAKDPALEADMQALEAVQKDKLTLRRFLDQEVPGNADGFSAYFADLARFHVRGLRLTEVELGRGGADVRLRGEVINGEYITNYIAGLDRSVVFQGKAFRNLDLDRAGTVAEGLPEGQSLIFEIRTGEALTQ